MRIALAIPVHALWLMIHAIRDQWVIAVAVVVLLGLAVWLWTTRPGRRS